MRLSDTSGVLGSLGLTVVHFAGCHGPVDPCRACLPAARWACISFAAKHLVELMILAPTIVPGIAVALGMHAVFISLGLTNTVTGVMLVHLVPTLPYMVLVMAGIFANYDPTFEAQARSLGAGAAANLLACHAARHPARHHRGGLFAFLVSWSQYILTLLIGGGRVVTLPLLLFNFAASGRNDITGAIGMIYILPGILILLFTAQIPVGPVRRRPGLGQAMTRVSITGLSKTFAGARRNPRSTGCRWTSPAAN